MENIHKLVTTGTKGWEGTALWKGLFPVGAYGRGEDVTRLGRSTVCERPKGPLQSLSPSFFPFLQAAPGLVIVYLIIEIIDSIYTALLY